jgi:hypothetical protein
MHGFKLLLVSTIQVKLLYSKDTTEVILADFGALK